MYGITISFHGVQHYLPHHFDDVGRVLPAEVDPSPRRFITQGGGSLQERNPIGL